MFENIKAFLVHFTRTFRIADFFDIIIISLFIYTFITWVRRSASKRIMVSVAIFAAIYALSRIFDMYMTEMFIKYFVVVILIAAIIIFQSDIRRMVETIGDWNIFKRDKHKFDIAPGTVNIIAEAVSKMAAAKTGALIAIKGKEIWDRSVYGGVGLNGKVSLPLVLSIFNKNSPGHDGAVLIEGDRITKFGAHLSLSTNHDKVSGGTRHAAALGLSEQTDALIIAVSEERGTISLASGGDIAVIPSATELVKKLNHFYKLNYADQNKLTWWRNRSFSTSLFSLAIAVIAWFLFAFPSGIVYRSFVVPIEYRNLPADFSLEDTSPLTTRVTLEGSEQAFRLLDPAAIAVSINLSELSRGTNNIYITGEDLNLPSGVELYNAEPGMVKIIARTMKEAEVSVEVRTTGKGKVKISVEPKNVKLLIPESRGGAPRAVNTLPVDISKINKPTTLRSRLVLPAGVRLADGEKGEVTISIEPDN
jgi:diadenylate cyclase